jgi:hypothetical protein
MINRLTAKENGQALAESALVMGILIGVIGLLVFAGDVFRRVEVLENAASEGGRAAQVWRPSVGVSCYAYVRQAAGRIAQQVEPITVSVATDGVSCDSSNTTVAIAPNTLITVQVEHTWSPIFFGTVFLDINDPPRTLTYRARVQDRHE